MNRALSFSELLETDVRLWRSRVVDAEQRLEDFKAELAEMRGRPDVHGQFILKRKHDELHNRAVQARSRLLDVEARQRAITNLTKHQCERLQQRVDEAAADMAIHRSLGQHSVETERSLSRSQTFLRQAAKLGFVAGG